jgi:hypothetical protein
MVAPIQFPDDSRVQHRFANLNRIRYHYLYAEPQNRKWKETVFLVSLVIQFSAVFCFYIFNLVNLEHFTTRKSSTPHIKLTPSTRSMDGLIFQQDGAIKFPLFWRLDAE